MGIHVQSNDWKFLGMIEDGYTSLAKCVILGIEYVHISIINLGQIDKWDFVRLRLLDICDAYREQSQIL